MKKNRTETPITNHNDDISTEALERSTLIVATFTSFVTPFMISAVNVAIPDIQATFHINAVLLSWISTAYLLATAVFLVPIGKASDIFGRKKVFIIGLLLFDLASLLCGLSPNIGLLLTFRVMQGAGAAMIVTTGMAILTSVFPVERRGRAIGYYVSAVYVGLSVGPTAGGALTYHFGWRSIFYIIFPMGLASVWITFRYLKKEWYGVIERKFDFLGSALYAASLVALIYGGSELPTGEAYMYMGAGAVFLVLFIIREKKITYPVFEVDLFEKNRVFAFSSLAALINYAATFAVTFMLSLYLQYVKGLNPQSAGLILMFQPVFQAVFSPLAGRMSDKVEPRILATTGMGLTAVSLLFFVFLKPATSIYLISANLAVLGIGFGIFSSPNMNAIMSSVEKKYFGVASGAVAAMRLLGQMLSMGIATVVFAVYMGTLSISEEHIDLLLKCNITVYTIFTSLCAIGVYFSLARGSLR